MNIQPHHALISLATTNFLTFAAMAPAVFDDSRLSFKRKAPFAAAYMSSSAAALYGILQEPSTTIGRSAASGALLVGSMATFYAAAQTTRSEPLTWIFSPDAPRHLVKEGPYQFIRHPFYAAYLGTFTAAAVASNHLAPLLALAAMATMYTVQTRTEETKFLRGPLAPEYSDYMKQAGRFWPLPATLAREVKDWVTAR